jgi:hypothetical protein
MTKSDAFFSVGTAGVALAVILFLICITIVTLVEYKDAYQQAVRCDSVCHLEDDECRKACLAKEVDG